MPAPFISVRRVSPVPPGVRRHPRGSRRRAMPHEARATVRPSRPRRHSSVAQVAALEGKHRRGVRTRCGRGMRRARRRGAHDRARMSRGVSASARRISSSDAAGDTAGPPSAARRSRSAVDRRRRRARPFGIRRHECGQTQERVGRQFRERSGPTPLPATPPRARRGRASGRAPRSGSGAARMRFSSLQTRSGESRAQARHAVARAPRALASGAPRP